MIKTIISVLLIAIGKAAADGYGGSVGGGASYGGGSVGNVVGFGGNSIGGGVATGPINAAVQSTHTVEIQTVSLPQTPIQPQYIEVDANVLPLTIHFKSASSHINVQQSHQPSQPGEVQSTSSEDEPHHLVHEVTKPIIQEVREVITPLRRVIQEIRPVQEDIQTIVSRGEPRNQAFLNQGFQGNFGPAYSAGGYSSGGPISGGAVREGSVSILSDTESKSIGSSDSSSSSGISSIKRYVSGSSSSSSGSKSYRA